MDNHYWSENWFTHPVIKKNFHRLREEVSEARFESAEDLRYVLSIIHQFEKDLGRTLLKLQAVVDILVEKGIVNEEELAAKAQEVDSLDGESDGILHPSIFRTQQEHESVPSARAYLIGLEKDAVTPREFLASLEDTDVFTLEEDEDNQDE